MNWFTISKENMEVTTDPSEDITVVVPQLSYTHDTSLWGYTAPMMGSRYKFTLFGTPKFGLSGISFVNATGTTGRTCGWGATTALPSGSRGRKLRGESAEVHRRRDVKLDQQDVHERLHPADERVGLHIPPGGRSAPRVRLQRPDRIEIRAIQFRIPVPSLRVPPGGTPADRPAEHLRV